MRHSFLRYVALVVPALAAPIGCSASGSDAQTHGPVFDTPEAGADAARDARTDGPHLVDASGSDASPPPADAASTDAPADSLPPPPVDGGSCSDLTALVAGSGTSFYEALEVGTGSWTLSSAAAPALSAPSIAYAPNAQGGGGTFVAAVRSTNDAIEFTASSGGGWPALQGVSGATTQAAPVLAALGAAVHLVYLGSNGKYYHGTFTGSWDAANDPVGGTGASQSFGPTAVGMASVAGNLLFAHRGGTSAQLYAEGWSAGSWSAAPVATAQIELLPPSVIAMNGGAADAMIAYVSGGAATDKKISFATRTGGTWAGPDKISDTLFSNDPISAAPLAGGKAVIAFRGTDGAAYATLFDGAAWSAATQLAAGAGGTPAVAPGACGDDAVAAVPVASGDLVVVHLRAGAWGPPVTVTGASNATSAAIVTSK